MSFTSFEFILFFAGFLILYFTVPARFSWLALLGGSLTFLAWSQLVFLLWLIVPGLTTYFLALTIDRDPDVQTNSPRWRFLLAVFLASLGLLTFKLAPPLGLRLNWLIPLGISFYTFRLLSYLIDVQRQTIRAERHVGRFLVYISFFPQLISGPIERASHFLPQLRQRAPFDLQRIYDGGKLIAWGLFKKMVIADRLALMVDAAYDNLPGQQGGALLLAVLGYSIQIYADFSGYSDIAIGLGRMLGFQTLENFRAPYFSASISEFWQRWHISLTTWLRDYIFLPLAYTFSRRIKKERFLAIKADSWSYIGAIMVTMLVCGLWHKVSWMMLLWGGLYSLWLVLSHLSRHLRRRLLRLSGLKHLPWLHRRLQVATTFSLVALLWILFRSDSIGQALFLLRELFHKALPAVGKILGSLIYAGNIKPLFKVFSALRIESYEVFYLACAIWVLFKVDGRSQHAEVWESLKAKPVWLRFSLYFILVMAILLLSVWDGGQFIYFKF